jgi:4-amino-4-deoxy-L-arabinose transferase-like glycosyltransferase
MDTTPRKIKRSSASLTGGFVVGFAVIALVLLITGQLDVWQTSTRWIVALVLGGALGVWVRIADL